MPKSYIPMEGDDEKGFQEVDLGDEEALEAAAAQRLLVKRQKKIDAARERIHDSLHDRDVMTTDELQRKKKLAYLEKKNKNFNAATHCITMTLSILSLWLLPSFDYGSDIYFLFGVMLANRKMFDEFGVPYVEVFPCRSYCPLSNGPVSSGEDGPRWADQCCYHMERELQASVATMAQYAIFNSVEGKDELGRYVVGPQQRMNPHTDLWEQRQRVCSYVDLGTEVDIGSVAWDQSYKAGLEQVYLVDGGDIDQIVPFGDAIKLVDGNVAGSMENLGAATVKEPIPVVFYKKALLTEVTLAEYIGDAAGEDIGDLVTTGRDGNLRFASDDNPTRVSYLGKPERAIGVEDGYVLFVPQSMNAVGLHGIQEVAWDDYQLAFDLGDAAPDLSAEGYVAGAFDPPLDATYGGHHISDTGDPVLVMETKDVREEGAEAPVWVYTLHPADGVKAILHDEGIYSASPQAPARVKFRGMLRDAVGMILGQEVAIGDEYLVFDGSDPAPFQLVDGEFDSPLQGTYAGIYDTEVKGIVGITGAGTKYILDDDSEVNLDKVTFDQGFCVPYSLVGVTPATNGDLDAALQATYDGAAASIIAIRSDSWPTCQTYVIDDNSETRKIVLAEQLPAELKDGRLNPPVLGTWNNNIVAATEVKQGATKLLIAGHDGSLAGLEGGCHNAKLDLCDVRERRGVCHHIFESWLLEEHIDEVSRFITPWIDWEYDHQVTCASCTPNPVTRDRVPRDVSLLSKMVGDLRDIYIISLKNSYQNSGGEEYRPKNAEEEWDDIVNGELTLKDYDVKFQSIEEYPEHSRPVVSSQYIKDLIVGDLGECSEEGVYTKEECLAGNQVWTPHGTCTAWWDRNDLSQSEECYTNRRNTAHLPQSEQNWNGCRCDNRCKERCEQWATDDECESNYDELGRLCRWEPTKRTLMDDLRSRSMRHLWIEDVCAVGCNSGCVWKDDLKLDAPPNPQVINGTTYGRGYWYKRDRGGYSGSHIEYPHWPGLDQQWPGGANDTIWQQWPTCPTKTDVNCAMDGSRDCPDADTMSCDVNKKCTYFGPDTRECSGTRKGAMCYGFDGGRGSACDQYDGEVECQEDWDNGCQWLPMKPDEILDPQVDQWTQCKCLVNCDRGWICDRRIDYTYKIGGYVCRDRIKDFNSEIQWGDGDTATRGLHTVAQDATYQAVPSRTDRDASDQLDAIAGQTADDVWQRYKRYHPAALEDPPVRRKRTGDNTIMDDGYYEFFAGKYQEDVATCNDNPAMCSCALDFDTGRQVCGIPDERRRMVQDSQDGYLVTSDREQAALAGMILLWSFRSCMVVLALYRIKDARIKWWTIPVSWLPGCWCWALKRRFYKKWMCTTDRCKIRFWLVMLIPVAEILFMLSGPFYVFIMVYYLYLDSLLVLQKKNSVRHTIMGLTRVWTQSLPQLLVQLSVMAAVNTAAPMTLFNTVYGWMSIGIAAIAFIKDSICSWMARDHSRNAFDFASTDESWVEMLKEHALNDKPKQIKSMLKSKDLTLYQIGTSTSKVLQHFIKNDKIGPFRVLIDNGADPDAQDEQDRTPLMVAMACENYEIAQVLLDAKANATLQDKQDKTAIEYVTTKFPLITCIKMDDTVGSNVLFKLGADVNKKDKKKNTPLIYAVKHTRLDCTKMLFARKDVEINSKNGNRDTALIYAIDRGYTYAVEELCSREDIAVDTQNKQGISALHKTCMAASIDRHEYCKQLLDKGANVNAQDKRERTPLHIAVTRGDIILARMLLEAGADPEIQASTGLSAIDLASHSTNEDMMELFRRATVETFTRKKSSMRNSGQRGSSKSNRWTRQSGLERLHEGARDSNARESQVERGSIRADGTTRASEAGPRRSSMGSAASGANGPDASDAIQFLSTASVAVRANQKAKVQPLQPQEDLDDEDMENLRFN